MTRPLLLAAAFLLAAEVWLEAAGGAAAPLPALTGRVVDGADMLAPAAREPITAELARYERASGHQIVVATVTSLDGETIESFALRLFNTWRLGDAVRNDGVLLLFSTGDRRLRIELGRGLEAGFSNADAAKIIAEAIVPQMQRGDAAGAVTGGIKAIEDKLDAIDQGAP